jgi:hypothetical protein
MIAVAAFKSDCNRSLVVANRDIHEGWFPSIAIRLQNGALTGTGRQFDSRDWYCGPSALAQLRPS